MTSSTSGDRELRGEGNGVVARLRKRLQLVTRTPEASLDERQVATDLRTVIARLARIKARGGPFVELDLSSHVRERLRRLEIVGSELLVLDPQRMPA